MEVLLHNSMLERGGPVMWVLLAVAIFGFVIFLERLLFLHKGQIRTEAFLEGIENLIRKRRLVEALTVCEETPGPVSGVIKAALLNYDEGEERMRQAVEAAALVELPILERRIGAIAAVAKIAPLLGLLGTVTGIITSFLTVQASEVPAYPNMGAFFGGIGEALLTTAAGLIIAVMAHVAHHFLFGRVKALVYDMEYVGHQMLQFLLQGLPENEGEETEK